MLQNPLQLNLKNVALKSTVQSTKHPNSIQSLTTQLLECNLDIKELLQSYKVSFITTTQTTKKPKFQKSKNPISSNKTTNNSNNQSHLIKLDKQLSKLKELCSSFFITYLKPKQQLDTSIDSSSISLLVKSYSIVINLKMFFSVYNTQPQQSPQQQIEEEVCALQKIINKAKHLTSLQFDSLPQKLVRLCIKQIFNINSLKEYELYNINSNEEFKYDQNTQIQFLYIISFIKLANHLKLFTYQKKTPEQIKIWLKIYQEGKQTFEKLKKTNRIENPSHFSKMSFIYQKQQEIQNYISWIEANWIPLLRERIQNKKTIHKEFSELPIQYFPTYQLFFIIHKLSELESKFVKSHKPTSKNLNKMTQILSRANESKTILQNYLMLQIKQHILSTQSHQKLTSDSLLFIVQATLKKLQNHIETTQSTNANDSYEKLYEMLENPSFKFIQQHIQKTSQKNIKSLANDEVKSLKVQESEKISQQRQRTPFSKLRTSKQQKDQHEELYEIQIPLQSLPNREQNISAKQEKQKKQYSIYKKIEETQPQLITKEETLQLKITSSSLMTPRKNTSNHPLSQNDRKESESKLSKKMISVCTKGHFLTKFNFNNNSSSLKFVKLSIKNGSLLWGDSRQDVKQDPSEQKFNKISGIVYGDVSAKIQYHCMKSKSSNKPVEPWKCFSFICSSRTLDFYCSENDDDIFFWLMGLSSYMNSQRNIVINFSRGKILWKKCLMKIRYLYSPPQTKSNPKDKKKDRFYMGKINARAIINFGKKIDSVDQPE